MHGNDQSSDGGSSALTGSVSFFVDGVWVGQGAVAQGTASCTVAALDGATHTITAFYSGNTAFDASTGTTTYPQ